MANAFGQNTDHKAIGSTMGKKSWSTDTMPKVHYVLKDTVTRTTAIFLDGKFLNQTLMGTLDPQQIESIKVLNENIRIDGVDYYGQVQIKTKNYYEPKAISLNELKEKYTNLKDKAALFMLDGNIISGDYDKYIVDENYLLSITIDSIKNPKENIDLGLVKILTKTKENIKKANQIIIRGAEMTSSR
jgi:hypothetical protein